jgi:hypothetical protein
LWECEKPVHEKFDIETSRWVCEVCGKPFKPASNRQKYCETHQKEVKKEQTRKRVQKFRAEWPLKERKCDNKTGTGFLGMHPHPNIEEESKEIFKEKKRLGLA